MEEFAKGGLHYYDGPVPKGIIDLSFMDIPEGGILMDPKGEFTSQLEFIEKSVMGLENVPEITINSRRLKWARRVYREPILPAR